MQFYSQQNLNSNFLIKEEIVYLTLHSNCYVYMHGATMNTYSTLKLSTSKQQDFTQVLPNGFFLSFSYLQERETTCTLHITVGMKRSIHMWEENVTYLICCIVEITHSKI